MNLDINATPVFEMNWNALVNGYRYLVNQGGSRSSKSYSILQIIIALCLKDKISVSIVRQSFPSLRASIMRDFFEILKDLDLYSESQHHKTEHTYFFKNGSSVEFFATDSEQKIRGRKRNILYCNEANELSFDVFNQLVLRTSGQVIIDFNPSDTEHWIYDLLKSEKSILIKSTYKDNVFLSKEQKEYIENLINVDENYYKIYALGERPIASTRIYSHFKQYIDEPDYSDWCYGLDFGYTHQNAMVKIMYVGSKIYVKEILYQGKMTAVDLKDHLKTIIDDNKPIYCDWARPEVIEELKRSGLNVKEAIKDVKAGINHLKSSEIYIHHESTNLLKEYKLYSWKSKGDLIYDEVIKLNDDLMDALRYGIYTHKKKKGSGEFLKFY
jgi:phage terminase large subunit